MRKIVDKHQICESCLQIRPVLDDTPFEGFTVKEILESPKYLSGAHLGCNAIIQLSIPENHFRCFTAFTEKPPQ